jgi:hypothetical protein
MTLSTERTLDPEVVARLLALSMDVWAWWWSEVGLPERTEFHRVELMRMTWPEN